MSKLTNKTIDRPMPLILLTIILVLLSIFGLRKVPVELQPDASMPIIIIRAIYPGASSDEVEQTFAIPVEKDLKSLDDLDEIMSTSSFGMGSVKLVFETGTDMDVAYDDVNEIINQVRSDLPAGIVNLSIQQIRTDEQPTLIVGIYGKHNFRDLKEAAEDAENILQESNLVSKTEVSGGIEEEVEIKLLPEKIAVYNIDISTLPDQIRANNVEFPSGELEFEHKDISVRTRIKFLTVEDIENVVITATDGRIVQLKDIADVKLQNEELKKYSKFKGQNCVPLVVIQKDGGNVIRFSDDIKKRMDKFISGYKKYPVNFTILEDQSDDTKKQIGELVDNALMGAGLVIIVLFFGLGFKNSIIVGLSIPVTFLFTLGALYYLDMSINIMSLFALIIVVGIVVDGAIIIAENIFRHYESGKGAVEAAKTGTGEVGMAVISSTFTTISAFVPFFLSADLWGSS